jgi:hypothetical protein
MLFIHRRLGLPSGLFPSGFPTNKSNIQPPILETIENKKT